MEKYGTNVIEMSVQGKKASSRLVAPDFDLVVVASRHEDRLCFVKVNSSDRTIVLLETINESSHAIIP